MNYHTFELYKKIDSNAAFYYEDSLWESGGKCFYDKRESVPTFVCNTLSDYGITINIKTFRKNNFDHYVLYYRINPRCIMEQYNYIGLFNENDTDVMLDRVNKYLDTINMPYIERFKLNRIDFCTNIELSGQDEIAEYIKLFQRGFYPKSYEPEMYYDTKSKRSKFAKNTFNVKRSNFIKITYYNKFDQLRENKKCRNIKDAENILRAEIQCGKRKVRHLSDKFGCTNVRTFLNHSSDIGEYVFRKYADLFCGHGDFYKIHDIRAIINSSHLKTKSKKMMNELIDLSAKYSSVDTALYKLGWTHKTTVKIIKKFDKIGVSPIVIPLRSSYDHFQNPLTLVLNSCENHI